MDELTENAEEPDEGEKPEVQKLGKLQYKVGASEIYIIQKYSSRIGTFN